MEIITRIEARKINQKWYFTGNECLYGHLSKRAIRDYSCHACQVIKKKRYRKNHPDKLAARAKQWRIKNKEKLNARQKAYNKRNPDKIRMYAKNWYRKNKEKARLRKRIYKQSNYEKVKEWQRLFQRKIRKEKPEEMKIKRRIWKSNRRARKKMSGGKYTAKEIELLLIKQKNKCMSCLASFDEAPYEVDHIMPLAKGGSNWISNIQLLCKSCNGRKNSKDPFEFARENGRLL